VRLVATGLLIVGGVLVLLSLMAIGVLFSGMQIDPAGQGGTGYLDFVLFFNGVLCLLPVTVLSIVLGLRLLRGDHWAWLTALVLYAILATMVPLVVFLLPAPPVFAIGPAAYALLSAGLLVTRPARAYVKGSET
jgi:hypothetical protein